MLQHTLILTLYFIYVGAVGPEVSLPNGKVEGYFKKTEKGTVYAAYEGIPYALQPIGKYRFEEPKAMRSWQGVWQAKTLTKCMQYFQYTNPGEDFVIGEEDCLHVNVYTQANGTLKDVIVFIHGGAFMFNSGGTYGEKYLMDRDGIVFVTFNYRLGPLGFLSTEDRFVPGNNGLKDQRLALKWIKENIEYFGGNPESITLAGLSAGGASVHIHSMSQTQNSVQLFHKAIMQSGTTLNPWVLAEKSREKAVRLGELVGCPTADTREMIKCMKYRPGRQIVDAVKHFQPWGYNPFTPFGVVIDTFSESPIVPQHPLKSLKEGKILNVPTIFSNVESEGLYPAAGFLGDNVLGEIDQRFDEIVPFLLDYNNTVSPEDIDGVSRQIREFYFDKNKITNDNFPSLIQMVTDRIFLVDIEISARLHARANRKATYHYYYSYQAANSKVDARLKTNNIYGPSHCDDTIMVLSTNTNTTSTEADKAMSKILQDMWIDFAKTGIPSPREVWSPVSKETQSNFNFLRIKSPEQIAMESQKYLGNRKSFWATLPIQENEKLFQFHDEL